MKRFLIALCSALMLTNIAWSQSYDIDFNDDANSGSVTQGERGVADGTMLNFGGVWIRLSATDTYAYVQGEEDPHLYVGENDHLGLAYLDAHQSGQHAGQGSDQADADRRAGLGVCGALGDNGHCMPTYDDELGWGETLTMSFFADEAGTQALSVRIDSIVFSDWAHNTVMGGDYADYYGDYEFILNGSTYNMLGYGGGDAGHDMVFSYGGDYYYIQSMMVTVVPEPATWLMMIIGFGIVAQVKRRRRRQAALTA